MPITLFSSYFLTGLVGSSHCLGMCGGLTASVSLSLPQAVRDSRGRTFYFLCLTHLGRLTSYLCAGALAGALGLWAMGHAPWQVEQRFLWVLAQLFMIAVGLYIAGWWMGLRHLEKWGGKLWQTIQPLSRRLLPLDSGWKAYVFGVCWGWLPCGLVYSMLVGALTVGSFYGGGLALVAFGLGTMPSLLLTGIAAQKVRPWLQQKVMRQMAGGTIIALAVYHLIKHFGM